MLEAELQSKYGATIRECFFKLGIPYIHEDAPADASPEPELEQEEALPEAQPEQPLEEDELELRQRSSALGSLLCYCEKEAKIDILTMFKENKLLTKENKSLNELLVRIGLIEVIASPETPELQVNEARLPEVMVIRKEHEKETVRKLREVIDFSKNLSDSVSKESLRNHLREIDELKLKLNLERQMI